MTENEIKGLLKRYVDAEMDLTKESEQIHSQEPSGKFKRKMKRLFSVEKYFGGHIRAGYFVRYAAVFAGAALVLLGTGQVGARILGIYPWKFEQSYSTDLNMERRDYQKPKDYRGSGKEDHLKKAVRDFPAYVSGGLPLKIKEQEKDSLYMEWWVKEDRADCILYDRERLGENLSISTQGEFDEKEACTVAGYNAFWYKAKDDNDYWLLWDDQEYNYNIHLVGSENPNPEEELLKMAESIYK